MAQVRVITSDNQEVSLDHVVAMEMITIKNLVDELGVSVPIPCPSVTRSALNHIVSLTVEQLKHKDDVPLPRNPKSAARPLEDWEITASAVYPFKPSLATAELPTIFEVLNGALFLEQTYLVEMLKIVIALAIRSIRVDHERNKTEVEVMREFFELVSDFTPEEEEQNRVECEYIEH